VKFPGLGTNDVNIRLTGNAFETHTLTIKMKYFWNANLQY